MCWGGGVNREIMEDGSDGGRRGESPGGLGSPTSDGKKIRKRGKSQ